MSLIEEKCKSRGVRLTEQRRVIAKVMSDSKSTFGSKDHPDVDELHKRVSLIDKRISIATVYRTLKLFEESGIIERHDFKEGKCSVIICTDIAARGWDLSHVRHVIQAEFALNIVQHLHRIGRCSRGGVHAWCAVTRCVLLQ